LSSEFVWREEEDDEHHPSGSSSEEEPLWHPRRGTRHQPNLKDIRVEVRTLKGRLHLNELLEWLQTVDTVFEYKEIPKDKKVKLVALKL